MLAPPPPVEPIADIAAAVRDALRFPLAGQPLEALVTRGGRATVVVEPPALPIPGSPNDPRRTAIAATMIELDRAGASLRDQTLLVAGGLARKAGHHELELLVHPEFARRFHGRVEVHDAEGSDLVEVSRPGGRLSGSIERSPRPTSWCPVSAAETVLNGGPATLLAASSPDVLRAANAYSLLETSASSGWKLGVELEQALATRVPLLGVSLTLNTPALGGVLHGYPHDPEAVDRIANSPLRGLFGVLPGPVRRGVFRHLPSELSALAVFAGPPSVAHAEALLRGVDSKSARLDEPLDAICIGIPHVTPHLPREAPNPALAAYLGLGLALRLWRDAFPLVEGGTAILLSRFRRRLPAPDPAAVPSPLPGAAVDRRPRARRASGGRAGGRHRQPGARCLSRGPLLPPRPAVPGVGRLPACRRAPGRRAHRRLPGRRRRATARLRPDARDRGCARHGTRPRRTGPRGSATCFLLRTSRSGSRPASAEGLSHRGDCPGRAPATSRRRGTSS